MIYEEKDFPDGKQSGFVYGDGDGTVNSYSASACLKWREQQQQDVYGMEMPGNEHVGILSNKTMHAYVAKVLLEPVEVVEASSVDRRLRGDFDANF